MIQYNKISRFDGWWGCILNVTLIVVNNHWLHFHRINKIYIYSQKEHFSFDSSLYIIAILWNSPMGRWSSIYIEQWNVSIIYCLISICQRNLICWVNSSWLNFSIVIAEKCLGSRGSSKGQRRRPVICPKKTRSLWELGIFWRSKQQNQQILSPLEPLFWFLFIK